MWIAGLCSIISPQASNKSLVICRGCLSSSGKTSIVPSCCTLCGLVFIVLVQPAFSMLRNLNCLLFGLLWCGLRCAVWCGMVCGMVRYGVVWCSLLGSSVWYGMVWHGVVYGMLCMVWCRVVWYGMLCGMWYGVVWDMFFLGFGIW